MSKITFRADEELIERIEARDASKSEIMREALREYLDASDGRPDRDPERSPRTDAGRRGARSDSEGAASLDALIEERVDELVAERLAAWEARNRATERAQDVNVNVTLERDAPAETDANRSGRASDAVSDRGDSSVSDGETPLASDENATDAARPSDDHADREAACGQCGGSLSDDHVYCPNCGEKASRRVFCECGDEVRSDWGFCPGCGRRTPAADVLEQP